MNSQSSDIVRTPLSASSSLAEKTKQISPRWLLGLGLLGLLLVVVPVLKSRSVASSTEAELVSADSATPVETVTVDQIGRAHV